MLANSKAPLAYTSTILTPTLSLAPALTVTVPLTMELIRGAVKATVGATVSLLTTETVLLVCPTLPAAS